MTVTIYLYGVVALYLIRHGGVAPYEKRAPLWAVLLWPLLLPVSIVLLSFDGDDQ